MSKVDVQWLDGIWQQIGKWAYENSGGDAKDFTANYLTVCAELSALSITFAFANTTTDMPGLIRAFEQEVKLRVQRIQKKRAQ